MGLHARVPAFARLPTCVRARVLVRSRTVPRPQLPPPAHLVWQSRSPQRCRQTLPQGKAAQPQPPARASPPATERRIVADGAECYQRRVHATAFVRSTRACARAGRGRISNAYNRTPFDRACQLLRIIFAFVHWRVAGRLFTFRRSGSWTTNIVHQIRAIRSTLRSRCIIRIRFMAINIICMLALFSACACACLLQSLSDFGELRLRWLAHSSLSGRLFRRHPAGVPSARDRKASSVCRRFQGMAFGAGSNQGEHLPKKETRPGPDIRHFGNGREGGPPHAARHITLPTTHRDLRVNMCCDVCALL
jgi:hypothetical protein